MITADRDRRHGPSHRQLRVGESLRHALADILARDALRDPSLNGQSITVSEVQVSPDLRHATVYVMPLNKDAGDEVLAGLERAAPYLSSQLGRQVRLKRTPRLHFVRDSAFDYANQVSELLAEPAVAKDLDGGETDGHEPG